MAFVKFYRGLKEKYDSVTHEDGIYFATDTLQIIMNGNVYGGGISSVSYVAPNIVITYSDGTSDNVSIGWAIAGDSTDDSVGGLISADDIYGLYQLAETSDDHEVRIVSLEALTDSLSDDIKKLQDEVDNLSSGSNVSEVTTQKSVTSNDITITTTITSDNGSSKNGEVTLPSATETSSGLMSATDKQALDNCVESIDNLKSDLDLLSGSVESSINDLDGRVSTLEDAISSLEAADTNINNELTNLQNEIDGIVMSSGNIKVTDFTLSAEGSTISGVITSSDNTSVDASVTLPDVTTTSSGAATPDMLSDIESNKNNVSALQGDVTTIQSDIDSIKNQLENMETTGTTSPYPDSFELQVLTNTSVDLSLEGTIHMQNYTSSYLANAVSLPVVSTSQAGIMQSSQYQKILDLEDKVDALESGTSGSTEIPAMTHVGPISGGYTAEYDSFEIHETITYYSGNTSKFEISLPAATSERMGIMTPELVSQISTLSRPVTSSNNGLMTSSDKDKLDNYEPSGIKVLSQEEYDSITPDNNIMYLIIG